MAPVSRESIRNESVRPGECEKEDMVVEMMVYFSKGSKEVSADASPTQADSP